jgi:hypothetical protein
MRWESKLIVAASCVLAACSSGGGFDESEGGSNGSIGSVQQAVLPTNDAILIATVDANTYLDISTSDTQYYVLTTTGVKRVNHTSDWTIPTAAHFKNIQLNRIDYVNSTWGLVGVRDKVGATPAQLVLKVDQASPRTVNFASDINSFKDFEARQVSSNLLNIYFKVESGGNFLIKTYSYNWSANTLTFTSQITLDYFTNGFTLPGATNYIVSSHLDLSRGFAPFRKSNLSGAIGNIDEDWTPSIDISGSTSSGFMDYVIHAYFTPSQVHQFNPQRMDYGKHNNSANNFYVGLNTGSAANTFDLVRLDAANVTFIKTPRGGDYSFWNGDNETLGSNNCYNYATNHRSQNFAQPGYQSTGTFMSSITPTNVRNASVSDGLEYVGNQATGWPTIPAGKTLVAAISGASDYHWYRRNVAVDGTVTWTHKPGWCNANNRKFPYAQSSPVVTDPRDSTAWSPSYNTFVGFFLVDSNYKPGQGVEYVNGASPKQSNPGGCGFYFPPTGLAAKSAAGNQSASQGLVVSVGLYQGQTNPEVLVDDPATIDQIRAAYAQVQQQGGTPEGVSPGYLGLLVSNPCKLSGLPDSFRLFTPPSASSAPLASAAAATAARTSNLESSLLDLAVQKQVINATERSGIRSRAGK